MRKLQSIAVIAVVGFGVYAYHLGAQPTVVGGNLKASKVPSAYAADIEQAGTVCPQITAALIAAQLNQESGFDPGSLSDTGAIGIAQFEPYNGMVTDGEVDPHDAASSIHGMAVLDCREYKKFGSVTLALAAYNAGEGAALNWRSIGQTRNYVLSIEASAKDYAAPNNTTTTMTTTPTNPFVREYDGITALIGDLK